MKSFYKLSKKQQMSEAFINNAFLALSGGFQDAYTYNTRNEVFSNAQTGNVVLMSQNLMTGNWQKGLRYLVPLLAFAKETNVLRFSVIEGKDKIDAAIEKINAIKA